MVALGYLGEGSSPVSTRSHAADQQAGYHAAAGKKVRQPVVMVRYDPRAMSHAP